MNLKSDDKSRHWKILESEYLHREPWLTVKKERLLLPNGKIAPEYYVMEYPNWVNVIAITREKKFIMVKQYRHGLGQVCYELCAGVCEKDDKSPLESAKRELKEETGYGNGKWSELTRVSPNASVNTNLLYCYIAEDVEKISVQALDDSEDLTVHLLTLDEVKQLLMDGEIIQSTMAAPLWKYMAVNHLL